MEWQDTLTIISFIIGIASFIIGLIGFVLTIFTYKKAGKIEIAIQKTKAEQLNKIKYINRKESFINELKQTKNKLSGDTLSLRSSGEIKQLFQSTDEVILNLLECCDHFKDKHKNTINLCREFIAKSLHGDYILNYDDCSTLREYIVQILIILNQEEYYI